MKMKIKKESNQTSSNTQTTSKSSVNANDNYAEAAEYIKCAISVLGKSALKSDILARESIVNLSVILMDLK